MDIIMRNYMVITSGSKKVNEVFFFFSDSMRKITCL